MHGTHTRTLPRDNGDDAHNPWATSPATSPHRTTFSSAYRHKHARGDSQVVPRPAYRRRGSESTLDAHAAHNLRPLERAPAGHVRSRTVDHRGERHPLGGASGSLEPDAAVTRPRLDRLLSSDPSLPEDAQCPKKVDLPERKVSDEEKTVIVHQVSSSDSLAGVALKYGVTLADLRRANKLWSSDTIHLRKVLYIPLDKSAQMKLLVPTSPAEEPSKSLSPSWDSPDTAKGLPASPPPNPPSSEIRRVPASQLSFFPPPSRSALPVDPWSAPSRSSHSDSPSRSNTLPRGFNPTAFRSSNFNGISTSFVPSSFLSSSTRTLTSNGASTLSSLFNAIPRVPIPLPRPIASRVSSESARLSSSPSASEDQEHELADLPASLRRLTLKPRSRTPGRDYAPPTPPAAGPPGKTALVRTAQPEPSPAMQIPRGPPPPPSGKSRDRGLAALSDGAVR